MHNEGMDRSRAITIAIQEIKEETLRTSGKWPPFHSVHEGYGVILEEMDEFWAEAKKKEVDPQKLRKEGVHLAAMVTRFIAELTMPK